MERRGAVTVKNEPFTLSGEEAKVGQDARDFTVLDADLKEKGLSDLNNKPLLIASVPSLDTQVCDLEIKRFNGEAGKFKGRGDVAFISMDLPFAQKRFCDSFSIDNVSTFSDHRDASFGMNYGVLIKELRLLARAVFVIDKEGKVRYVEYVRELTSHPDYDKALNALSGVL